MKGSITHTNGARHGEPRRCRITGCCHSAFNAIVKKLPPEGVSAREVCQRAAGAVVRIVIRLLLAASTWSQVRLQVQSTSKSLPTSLFRFLSLPPSPLPFLRLSFPPLLPFLLRFPPSP